MCVALNISNAFAPGGRASRGPAIAGHRGRDRWGLRPRVARCAVNPGLNDGTPLGFSFGAGRQINPGAGQIPADTGQKTRARGETTVDLGCVGMLVCRASNALVPPVRDLRVPLPRESWVGYWRRCRFYRDVAPTELFLAAKSFCYSVRTSVREFAFIRVMGRVPSRKNFQAASLSSRAGSRPGAKVISVVPVSARISSS